MIIIMSFPVVFLKVKVDLKLYVHNIFFQDTTNHSSSIFKETLFYKNCINLVTSHTKIMSIYTVVPLYPWFQLPEVSCGLKL